MKNNKKTLSLNKTILNIVLIGYFTILLFLVCMDSFLIINYQRENTRREEQALESYVENVEDSMERIRRVLYDVYMDNEEFRELSLQLSGAGMYSHAYDLRKALEGQMMVEENLHGFYIYYGTDDQPLYHVNTEQLTPEHARRIGKALGQNRLSDPETKASNWINITIDDNVYLALSYEKKNVTVYGIRNLGNAQSILQEQSGKQVEICLIDSGKDLLKSNFAEDLNIIKRISEAKDKVSYLSKKNRVCAERVQGLDLWICAVYPRTLVDYLNLLHIFLILFTVGLFMVALSVYFFLKRNLVQPLEMLRNEMEKIRSEDNKNVGLIDMRFTELKEVNETLCAMILKLEEQRLLTYDEFIEKQKAQLQYLQLQMQPHFYLNGLKTLNALVLQNETEKVQALIINLSEHLRYLLQAEKEMTTLNQELQFTENYAKLRGQMTGRPIELYIDADSILGEWNVPMLAAQTFVENSIKYAKTGSVESALIIEIQADFLETEKGNFLNLMIRDNGKGYEKEVLDDINGLPEAGKKNIGINNLKRRCQILYGENVEFTFYNHDGAVSEIVFPEMYLENGK